jgi:hypothetical protein
MERTHAPAFTAWLDDFFAAYYRRHPVNATFIGIHDYDDRLPDLSIHGMEDTMTEIEGMLYQLRELPNEPLTDTEALDRQLAEGVLEIERWERGYRRLWHSNPTLYTSEAVFSVIALFLRPFSPLAQRVEMAIARMSAIPTLLSQGQKNIRRAPLAWIERARRECVGALAFFRGGIDQLVQEQGIIDHRFRVAADSAVTAFRNFQRYLEDDLYTHSSKDYACGEEALNLLMQRGHFLLQDVAEIEAYASSQLATCEAYLTEHADDFGVKTYRDVLAQLEDHHPTVDRYYARYAELWEASRATAEANRLLTWPDYPIRFVPQPIWVREAAPYLYFLPYRSPSPYDHLTPVDYLVPPIDPDLPPLEQERRLRATNESVIKLNHVIHHGGIGHHVQNWYAYRAASRIGQIAAVDCATRIAMLCGGTMAEGWACYATDLLDEVGFLTPLEHYAQHHTRLRMAVRALVDIGLHRGTLTFEQAVAFYQDRTGMSSKVAWTEVVKNSMFPGTAMIYLVGSDLIHGLRRDLVARYSSVFDLRQFHDRLLSYGSVPVPLICAAMRKAYTE